MRYVGLLVECIEYVALMFLCCLTVKLGHIIIAIIMLFIGSVFLFGIGNKR